MNKRFIASIFRKAANIIKEKGLAKGALVYRWDDGAYPQGSVCAVGAINCALTGDPCSGLPDKSLSGWSIPLRNGDTGVVLVSFNNAPETTQKDVIRRLRDEAFAAEHGGKTRDEVKGGKVSQ